MARCSSSARATSGPAPARMAAERVRSPWIASAAAADLVHRDGDGGGLAGLGGPAASLEDLGDRDGEEQHEWNAR